MRRGVRISAVVLIYAMLLALGHLAHEGIDLSFFPGASDAVPVWNNELFLLAGLGLYVILVAIPFIPGMEVSVALLMIFGPKVAPALYVATVLSLTLAYWIGSKVPPDMIAKGLGAVGMNKAQRLVGSMAPLTPEEKLNALIERAPNRIVPFLLKYRYAAILVAFNMPGNTVIGGGGGIALLVGMSGIFTFRHYLTAVSLAVMPVPIAVVFFGQ